MNRYEMSVFLACAELHGNKTGATRKLSKEEVNSTILWLRDRLADWQPSKKGRERYDEAVRMLIIATMQEYT